MRPEPVDMRPEPVEEQNGLQAQPESGLESMGKGATPLNPRKYSTASVRPASGSTAC